MNVEAATATFKILGFTVTLITYSKILPNQIPKQIVLLVWCLSKSYLISTPKVHENSINDTWTSRLLLLLSQY